MSKHKTIHHIVIVIIFSVFIWGCKKDTDIVTPESTSGKIKIIFSHVVGNNPLILNSNQYFNEAGNQYEIYDLMYFISDVKLHLHQRAPLLIDQWTAIHYVDAEIPSTLNWDVYDSIPQGVVDSVSFVFGISEQRNQSFMFVNPPESNMAWPDILGGGYHYMMINGKWIDPQQMQQPFDFHLGIGQIYTDTITYNTNSISGFVQNYFDVTLPTPGLSITANSTSLLKLQMDVSSWFKTPHSWDFNYWGGSVMQRQQAMNVIKENGFDVFSVVQ
jgi:hypothetical protein